MIYVLIQLLQMVSIQFKSQLKNDSQQSDATDSTPTADAVKGSINELPR
jgi:hypothetical protein